MLHLSNLNSPSVQRLTNQLKLTLMIHIFPRDQKLFPLLIEILTLVSVLMPLNALFMIFTEVRDQIAPEDLRLLLLSRETHTTQFVQLAQSALPLSKEIHTLESVQILLNAQFMISTEVSVLAVLVDLKPSQLLREIHTTQSAQEALSVPPLSREILTKVSVLMPLSALFMTSTEVRDLAVPSDPKLFLLSRETHTTLSAQEALLLPSLSRETHTLESALMPLSALCMISTEARDLAVPSDPRLFQLLREIHTTHRDQIDPLHPRPSREIHTLVNVQIPLNALYTISIEARDLAVPSDPKLFLLSRETHTIQSAQEAPLLLNLLRETHSLVSALMLLSALFMISTEVRDQTVQEDPKNLPQSQEILTTESAQNVPRLWPQLKRLISNLIALAVPRNFLTHTVRLHQSHMYLILKSQQNLRPATADITK